MVGVRLDKNNFAVSEIEVNIFDDTDVFAVENFFGLGLGAELNPTTTQ